MIRQPEIWNIIQAHLPRERWIPLSDIYELVEYHANLDAEDFEPQAPGSDIPKWKRNVRNVLQHRKGTGEIRWDEGSGYLLPFDFTLSPPSQTPNAEDLNEPEEATRVQCKTYRILRDTARAREIKAMHHYKCQICGNTLQLSDGSLYAEAHHIKPLGSPHNGPDVRSNILCVCPNHHVLLDYGAIRLDTSELRMCPEHHVESKYIDYHNSNIFCYGAKGG